MRENGGLLCIRSGRGALSLDHNGPRLEDTTGTNSLVIDADHHCTLVDFRLKIDYPIDLKGIGIFKYENNSRLEDLVDDEGAYVSKIADVADDVGTRDGGVRTRTRVTNLLTDSAVPMFIDFTGIDIVSASFMDEFLGKLAGGLGSEVLHRNVKVAGLGELNKGQLQSVLSRCIID